MRRSIIAGSIAATIGSTLLWADGINIPAPSWTYSITSLGTGVATALGINVGSAGAPVVNGGVLGTPSSGVATNLTSIPVANATGVLSAANGGAGTISGALKGNGSGTVTQAASTDLSDVIAPTTWTPTDQSGASLSFSTVNAKYTKINNIITYYGTLTYPVTANGSNAIISMPVAVPNQSYASSPCAVFSTAVAGLLLVTQINTTTAAFKTDVSGAVLNSSLSTAVIAFMCQYPAS